MKKFILMTLSVMFMGAVGHAKVNGTDDGSKAL